MLNYSPWTKRCYRPGRPAVRLLGIGLLNVGDVLADQSSLVADKPHFSPLLCRRSSEIFTCDLYITFLIKGPYSGWTCLQIVAWGWPLTWDPQFGSKRFVQWSELCLEPAGDGCYQFLNWWRFLEWGQHCHCFFQLKLVRSGYGSWFLIIHYTCPF